MHLVILQNPLLLKKLFFALWNNSITALSAKDCAGVVFIPSQVKTRKERFLRLYLFIFVGGPGFQEMINQNRQALFND